MSAIQTGPRPLAVARPRPSQRRAPGGSSRLWRASPLTYVTLIATVALSVFPIYWMLVVATRTNDVVGDVPPPLLPGGNLGANVQRLFSTQDAHFAKGLLNSALASSVVALSVMLGTMMVPVQMGIIPLYMIMVKLHWTGQLQAVIVPFLVTGFGVFMMRQYASQAVPDELIDAARVDGASTVRIYWHVVLPALRPAMAVLGLFTFMQTWNEFMWPLVVLNPDNPTVQLSLNQLNSAYFTDYTLLFSGTLISTVPLLVIFALFGRQIIGGIMEGALKA
jgi:cellobiose transport system permease protein